MFLSDDAKLELAVQLFERGFREADIEAALKSCGTLEDAMNWFSLRAGFGGNHVSSLVAAGVAPHALEENQTARRRVRRKEACVPSAMNAMKKDAMLLSVEWLAQQNGIAPLSVVRAAPTPQKPSKPSEVCAVHQSVVVVQEGFCATAAPPVLDAGVVVVQGLMEMNRAEVIGNRALSLAASYVIEPIAAVLESTSTAAGTLLSRSLECQPIAPTLSVTISSPTNLPVPVRLSIPEVDIKAMDSLDWWRNAAARWPSIVSDLRAKRCAQGSISVNSLCGGAVDFCQGVRTEVSVGFDGDANLGDSCSDRRSGETVVQPSVVEEPAALVTARVKLEGLSGSTHEDESEKQKTSNVLSVGEVSGVPATRFTAPSRLSVGRDSLGCGRETSSSRCRRSTSPRSMRLNSTPALCSICCNDVPSLRAVELPCGHGWYCAQCVLRHAEARLALGEVSVTCPECKVIMAERVLKKLVPQELMDRLLARSLEQAVSCAADLVACPTPDCPMRVALEAGAVPRLKCTHCKKESCVKCGAQPYHRNMTCEEYAGRTVKGSGKGNKRIHQERERMESEQQFLQWMRQTGTKQCPTCHAAVSKQNIVNQHTQHSECHKMLCRICSTKFCFKCSAVLTSTFSCKCSRAEHGFCDPHTGERVEHMPPQRKALKRH